MANLFVANIKNTSNTNTFRNNGISISAGHDNFNSTQSYFIQFIRPDNTILGGIHQKNTSDLIFYMTSDRRRKTEIKPTQFGISDLMRIKVRDFKWNDSIDSKTKTTGFIAQEMYEVFPSAARKGGADPKRNPWQIAPTELIPLMVKSTQDQQKQIERLQTENDETRTANCATRKINT